MTPDWSSEFFKKLEPLASSGFARRGRGFHFLTGVSIAAGLLVVLFVGFFAYELSDRNMCGSHGLQTFNSPDGKLRAVLYEYDCGATTDFSTRLAVTKRSAKFDPFEVSDTELILTADSNLQAVKVDLDGFLPIEVVWTDSKNLVVYLPKGARTFIRKTQVGSLTVHYKNGI